jgi:hypothetical protein
LCLFARCLVVNLDLYINLGDRVSAKVYMLLFNRYNCDLTRKHIMCLIWDSCVSWFIFCTLNMWSCNGGNGESSLLFFLYISWILRCGSRAIFFLFLIYSHRVMNIYSTSFCLIMFYLVTSVDHQIELGYL